MGGSGGEWGEMGGNGGEWVGEGGGLCHIPQRPINIPGAAGADVGGSSLSTVGVGGGGGLRGGRGGGVRRNTYAPSPCLQPVTDQ